MTKSEHIRNLLTEQPDLTETEVAEILGRQGITFHKSLVGIVRMSMRHAPVAPLDPAECVRRVRKLAADVGGMKRLSDLVEVIAG